MIDDTWKDRLTFALAKAKRERGLTQEKLAVILGVRQGTLSNWKNGLREPDFKSLNKLSTALNIRPEWLLFGDVEKLSLDETHIVRDYRDNPEVNKDALRTIARSGRLINESKNKANT